MTSIWQDGLDAIYESDIAVDATLQISESTPPLAVRVIDKTVGVALPTDNGPDIETIVPAAVIRMATLADAGLTANDVNGATLTIDGKPWTVSSRRYQPSPDGETRGELVLILKDGEL